MDIKGQARGYETKKDLVELSRGERDTGHCLGRTSVYIITVLTHIRLAVVEVWQAAVLCELQAGG
jgi:hypothetical protein